MRDTIWRLAAALTLTVLVAASARAQDTLKLAVGQRGNCDSLCVRARPAWRRFQETRPRARNSMTGILGPPPRAASGLPRRREA